jgi:hypothetical protein
MATISSSLFARIAVAEALGREMQTNGRAENTTAASLYARRRISARASASAVLARSVSRLSCSFLPMRPFFR